MRFSSSFGLVLFALGLLLVKVASQNYADALTKSILFFEGQRSGKLPPSQRMKWRKDSALYDGDNGVDLTGGYYDAGDNVKFNFPMAFSMTTLAWGVIEFGNSMGSDLAYAAEAVRWGADYLLKSTNVPNKVYVQISNATSDHNCWERPEDMDTDRTAFFVTDKKPGSEVAAETAAALASSSILFKSSDPGYSQQLLQRASQVFEFADKYRGKYNDHLGKYVCQFYCDIGGYEDELVWAAAWLYKATNDQKYWNYIMNSVHLFQKMRNVQQISRYSGEFGWDDKHAGIYILIANDLLTKGTSDDNMFLTSANGFVCGVLPDSPFRHVNYSRGGLIFKKGGSNMQHTTALSFLLLVYSRYLSRANEVVQCGDKTVSPERLIEVVKGQVDYILGNNPMKMSYMVGYGEKFPQRIHHRGSSLPSIDKHPEHIGCKDGTPYFQSHNPNLNELTGAVVGGPFPDDTYPDYRPDVARSEPTTYINAPLVGVLAYFTSPQTL